MVYLGVCMIRSSCEHNALEMLLFHNLKHSVAFSPYVFFKSEILFRAGINRSLRFLKSYRAVIETLRQILCDRLQIIKRHERIDIPYAVLLQVLDIILDNLGIRTYNRAVEMVVGSLVLDMFIRDIRIEYRLDSARNKVLYMPVHELCRIAYRLRRNSLHTALIDLVRRPRRQHNPEPELCEHGKPEREILVLIEYTRYSYLAARRFLRLERNICECLSVLILENVRQLLLVFLRSL